MEKSCGETTVIDTIDWLPNGCLPNANRIPVFTMVSESSSPLRRELILFKSITVVSFTLPYM